MAGMDCRRSISTPTYCRYSCRSLALNCH
jgi:hypothetical protein